PAERTALREIVQQLLEEQRIPARRRADARHQLMGGLAEPECPDEQVDLAFVEAGELHRDGDVFAPQPGKRSCQARSALASPAGAEDYQPDRRAHGGL